MCLKFGVPVTKKSLEEEMTSLSHKQNDWLEPFQNWLKVAQGLDGIASDSDLFSKKVCAKEIFGSNLLLGEKTVRASAPDLDSFLANSPLDSGRNSGGNHWDALRASRMLASKKPISSLMVPRSGFEPPRDCSHYPLKVARLPVSPPGHK